MRLLKLIPAPETVYYDKGFLIVIENHMPALKAGSYMKDIPPYFNIKYKGDFYGILNEFRILPQYHHIVAAVNGLRSPTDYAGQFSQILIPEFTFIDNLKNVYLTKK